jgi:hypothetical protein
MIGQLSKEEINRKLLHLLAIILPFGMENSPNWCLLSYIFPFVFFLTD